MILKIFIAICICMCTICCMESKSKVSNKVSNYIKISEKYLHKNPLQALKYSKLAEKKSHEDHSSVDLCSSYVSIATVLFYSDMYNESLDYLQKAKNICPSANIILFARITQLKALNYAALDLGIKEEYELNSLLKLVYKSNNAELVKMRPSVYAYYSNYFNSKGDIVKANTYIDKALFIESNLQNHKFNLPIYIEKIDLCLAQNKSDSAIFYVQKCFEAEKKTNDYNANYILHYYLGKSNLHKSNLKSAIIYYNKSLADMKKFNIKDLYCSLNTKNDLARIYKKIGDKDNYKKYSKLVLDDKIKLTETTNKGLKKAIKIVLEEGEEEDEKNKFFYIVIIISTSIFLSVFIFVYYIKWKKICLNNKVILESEKNLTLTKEELEKEKIILSKQVEQTEYKELIDLAKSNCPEFLPFFEKLYPEFVRTIKELNPKLRNSELHFLALAYLNFSTKDIANYTFVTISAVQLRKNRIRKKYSIPSDADFNFWLKNLEDK